MRPKEWWEKPENGKIWIRREKTKIKHGDPSLKIVLDEFEKDKNKFREALEVGAGSGRIIGPLSKIHKKRFIAADINIEHCDYIEKRYKLTAHNDDIINLNFLSNGFDLVYTYQVLQHVDRQDILKALTELLRVSRGEVWLFEGWGDLRKWGVKNGHMRHKGDGGTFYWDLEWMLKCYETKMIEIDKKGEAGIKLYKIKAIDNKPYE